MQTDSVTLDVVFIRAARSEIHKAFRRGPCCQVTLDVAQALAEDMVFRCVYIPYGSGGL